jgi:hypothetical protein
VPPEVEPLVEGALAAGDDSVFAAGAADVLPPSDLLSPFGFGLDE